MSGSVKAELGDATAPSVSSLFSRDSPPPPGAEAESSSTPHRSRAATPANGVKEEKNGFDRVQEEGDDGLPSTAVNSRTGSPVPGSARRGRKKALATPPPPPKLIDDLPLAWDAAHETFETLDRCVYETKRLGLSREQDEMMVCDCVWDKGQSKPVRQSGRSGLIQTDDPDADPCGPHSDCINRAIFIECLADECRAGRHCRNQRLVQWGAAGCAEADALRSFSRRQFANVEIVQTEMKGFGLRAGAFLPA